MEAKLKTDLTVRDINEGFVYNEYEGKGLFGWGGKLTIQPEYQRNYIYFPSYLIQPYVILVSSSILEELIITSFLDIYLSK